MRPPFEGRGTASAILSAPLLAPYLRPSEFCDLCPAFPRLQVGRKTPVLRPTCDLQFMHWNRTIYFSRTFSWHGNARSELEMLPPSPNLSLFFPTLLPPPHRICLLYRCRCRLLTFPAAVVTPRQRRQSGGDSAAAVCRRWAVGRWHQQR